MLAGRGVGRVVVTGAQSDACIRATLHGALVRGYDVTLVGDAHTTEDLTDYGAPTPDLVISHTNLYWQWASAPGRRGDVVPTGEVDLRASRQPSDGRVSAVPVVRSGLGSGIRRRVG